MCDDVSDSWVRQERAWSVPTDLLLALFGSKRSESSHCFGPLSTVASPAMGHWGTCPPTTNNFILVRFGVNLRANYPSIV